MNDLERMQKLYRESTDYIWKDTRWKHNFRRRVNRLGEKHLSGDLKDRNAIVLMFDIIVYRNWERT